jgi:hypothetical protein
MGEPQRRAAYVALNAGGLQFERQPVRLETHEKRSAEKPSPFPILQVALVRSLLGLLDS